MFANQKTNETKWSKWPKLFLLITWIIQTWNILWIRLHSRFVITLAWCTNVIPVFMFANQKKTNATKWPKLCSSKCQHELQQTSNSESYIVAFVITLLTRCGNVMSLCLPIKKPTQQNGQNVFQSVTMFTCDKWKTNTLFAAFFPLKVDSSIDLAHPNPHPKPFR